MTTAEAIAVRLDLDLEGGRVSAPGRMLGLDALQPNLETLLQSEGSSFAVVVLSKGDHRPLDLGLIVDGIPREVDMLTAKVALKEFETGRRYDIQEGDGTEFALVQRDGLPRYRFLISLSASQMRRILQNYGDPRGTFVDLIAEIETQYRYNPADYSPGASVSEDVATGAQTVHIPVSLIQANGTVAYQLSVVATPLPDSGAGGWGSAPIFILNQAVNITVSGGNVVAQVLSIAAGTRGADTTPSAGFIPHWVTSVDPIRIDPATGGLELEIDLASQPMNTSIFGAMPATIWRAEKVPCRNLWVNGTYYANGSPDAFSFLDAGGTAIGSHTMPASFAAQNQVINGVGNFHLFAGRGNGYTTDFIWKTEPTAKFVRSAHSGTDVPVVAETVPAGPTLRFDVTLTAEGPSGSTIVTRVSSQSFVVRLRRDLIPDVAPATS
jgi:hypothetical protein